MVTDTPRGYTGEGVTYFHESKGIYPMSTPGQLSYSVPGVSCGHCRTAITTEVEQLEGVSEVEVDLEEKRVTVAGEQLDDAAVRRAIDQAGYDVA